MDDTDDAERVVVALDARRVPAAREQAFGCSLVNPAGHPLPRLRTGLTPSAYMRSALAFVAKHAATERGEQGRRSPRQIGTSGAVARGPPRRSRSVRASLLPSRTASGHLCAAMWVPQGDKAAQTAASNTAGALE